MPTLVDALYVSIGLDPSDFVKGQKQIASEVAKTKDAVTKAGKQTEEVSKGMTEGFGKASRSVIELFALLTGGVGFKAFIENAVKADTSIGLLNTSLGGSPELLSAWGTAAARMGGSAASAMASIQSLSDRLVDMRTQGRPLPIEMWLLQAQSKTNLDFTHGPQKLMIDLAKAAKELAKTDPAAASRYLRALGFDPAMSALMIRQGANLKAYLETQKQYAPSQRDIDAAGNMTDAQAKLAASYDLLATKVMTALSPALTWLADKLADLIKWIADFAAAHPKLVIGLTAVFAILTGAAAVAAIASVGALTAALVGLGGISFAGLLSGLAALGLTGAAGAGIAALLGAFDEADAKQDGAHGQGMIGMRARARQMAGGTKLSGNDAVARRGHGSANMKSLVEAAQDQLVAEGVSRDNASAAAAALVGNVIQESGGDPNKIHDGGTGYGLYGARNERRTKMLAWLAANGFARNSAEGQMRYMAREAMTDPRYRRTADALRGATAGNLGDVTNTVATNFESPKPATANYSGRRNNAALAFRGGPLLQGMPHLRGKTSMLDGGARQTAALNSIANDYRATTTSTSSEAHLHGDVNIVTSATDASGIAGSIGKALRNAAFAQTANFGPA